MQLAQPVTERICATVSTSRPALGLVYLEGDDSRTWVITKTTRGEGIALLKPGARVALTIADYRRFALVDEYAAID